MHLRRSVAFLATLTTAVVGASGCTGHGAVKQDVAGTNGYQSGNLALEFVQPAQRHRPGAVTGTLLDGRSFDLSQWRGKVVVVNFWGSWCAECHAEAEAVQQVHVDTAGKGVEFLGVDTRDDTASGRNYQKQFGVTYPSLDDPSNLVALKFRGMAVNATPTTIVLDRQGRMAARWTGSVLYRQLTDLVQRVLGEPA